MMIHEFIYYIQASEEKSTQLGVKLIAIDYSNINSIVTVLQENRTDTVLSTINSVTGNASEFALIEAANKSTATKRYIPNTWGIKYTPEYVSKVFTIKITLITYTINCQGGRFFLPC